MPPSTPLDPPQEERSDDPETLSPQDIQSLWNLIPGVKTCREMGKGIKTRLLSRIKEHPERAWWESLLAQVQASHFLCGRTNGSKGPFQASLSWALTPENLEKILAGNYENQQPVNGQSQAGCEYRVFHGVRLKGCGDPVVPGSKFCEQHRSSKPVLRENEVAL